MTSGLLANDTALSAKQKHETAQRFREVFFDQQISKDQTSVSFNEFSYPLMPLYKGSLRLTAFWLFTLFAIVYGIHLLSIGLSEWRWTWGIVGLGLILTSLAYTATVFLSYQFAFAERGPLLPSYVRYMHSIALPLVLAAFAPLLPAFEPNPGGKANNSGKSVLWFPAEAFLIGLTALLVFETPYPRPLLESNPEIPIRMQTREAAELIREEAAGGAAWVFLPMDTPNGFNSRVLAFELSPVPAFVETSDRFVDLPDSEILRIWKNYSVVWMPLLNDELVARVEGVLGETLRSHIIRVQVDADGRPVLTQIPTG